MDRQVKESLNLLKASKIPEECLNLKSEWGGSKLPGLQVSSPKGTGKMIEGREVGEKTGSTQGDKRIVTDPGESEEIEQGNLKRRRMSSPDKERQNPGWKKKPRFFPGQDTGGR